MKFLMSNSLTRKHPQGAYWVYLVLAVTLLFLLENAYMLATGRELIWKQDALPLYVNFLLYAKNATLQAYEAFAAGGGLQVPMYTYSMGYGVDVPMTMGSYLQDPLNIIPALLPASWINISYPAMTYVRMVLAAVAFSVYCFGHGRGRAATGIASLVYVTCGFILILGVYRHAKFIDWAILLPLMLYAADLLFKRRGHVLFTVVMFLLFSISIYYSYMSCLILLVYCLVKYFFTPRRRSVGDFLGLVAVFAALGIVAFLLSSPFSMTQITALLSQGRATSGGARIEYLMSLTFYSRIAPHFAGVLAGTDSLVQNSLSLLGLFLFVLCGRHLDKGTRRVWGIGLALALLGLFTPLVGHVMNAMGYSTDRWMLLLGFVCAYLVCLMVPELHKLDDGDWRRVRIAAIVYCLLVAAYVGTLLVRGNWAHQTLWTVSGVLVFLVFLALLRRSARDARATRTLALCIALAFCSTGVTAAFYTTPLGDNWGDMFPKAGTVWKAVHEDSPAVAMQQVEDDGLYRYTLPRVYGGMRNSAIAHEPQMAVDCYTSFYNQGIDDLRQSLGLDDHFANISYVGSGSRMALDTLTDAKYAVYKKGDAWRVTHGFEDTGIVYGKFHIALNANAVPLAFLAPGTMTRSEYDSLTMWQRQEALLQAAVMEDDTAVSAAQAQPAYASKEIPFTVKKQDGLSIEDGVVHVTKADATMTIEFQGLAQSEAYLCFDNLAYRGFKPSEAAERRGETHGLGTAIRDLLWKESTQYGISVKLGKHTDSIKPVTNKHVRYGGKSDWVMSLGYQEKAPTKMKVTFGTEGDYTFDAMTVVCQPVADIAAHAQDLAQAGLQDIELVTNGMKASAVLGDDAPQVAVFTVAYGAGWSVTVDGRPAKALKTDVGFLGVELSGQGTHSIEWTYFSPGLKLAIPMFAIGILGFALVIFLSRRRKSDDIQIPRGKHAASSAKMDMV